MLIRLYLSSQHITASIYMILLVYFKSFNNLSKSRLFSEISMFFLSKFLYVTVHYWFDEFFETINISTLNKLDIYWKMKENPIWFGPISRKHTVFSLASDSKKIISNG